jgi:cell fate (sporulation/competence/biofilm development) regulator YmcA (YheA/YmcA/DUF963 family)
MSLTEKELDLLVDIQKLNRKMKKLEKVKEFQCIWKQIMHLIFVNSKRKKSLIC